MDKDHSTRPYQARVEFTMRLDVRRFDPKTMKPHRTVLFVGKRGTGKSILLADIMSHMHARVDFGLAMTPTEESAASFRRVMPESWIYNNFNGAKLESMLAMQRELGKQNKQRSLFCVLDDCMYDKRCMKSLGIRDLFMNGRHLRCSLWFAVQYLMDLTPDLRTNVDYVFALKENIISNKQKLWRYFYGMFDRYEDFSRVLDRCTENYSCLVLDNTVPSSKVEGCIFWYRASVNLPPFRMGKPLFWKLAERTVKTNEDRQRDEKAEARARHAAIASRADKRITYVTRHDASGKPIDDDCYEILTLN